MTIREAGKGIVKSGVGTYQIGFTDLYGEEHETELSAHNMKELEERRHWLNLYHQDSV
mgnify:CR=1 FL=1